MLSVNELFKKLSVWGCVGLVLSLLLSTASAQPSAQLVASRTSGPAPLAVLFDATDTTHSDTTIDTYRQLGYYFDFDDPDSGTWAISGQSKNRETGAPLAGHVFDSPGVYRVGVRARDAQGRWSDAWQTITVTDPNTVFAGTDTVVMSRASDFTGAPTGAQRISNITAWPVFQSGKRYLLKAGEDFSTLGPMLLRDVSNFQIGTFGSGGRAVVDSVTVTMDEDNAASPPVNGVVQNLQALTIRQNKTFHHLLVYRNRVEGNGAGISNAQALEWYAANQRGTSTYADWQWCRGTYIVENHADMNNINVGPKNPIQGGGKWMTILGNYSTDANEHTARVFYSHKSVVGHNELTGMNTTGGRHALKMHARGLQEWNDYLFPEGNSVMGRPRSRYLRVHNNTLGNANSLNAWTLQVAPQDTGSSNTVEGLQDVVVEGNQFISGLRMNADMQTLGSRITERGNTRQNRVYAITDYPSSYPNDASWHGPYYIDDSVPAVSPPDRGEQTVSSPPLPPVLSVSVTN